MAHIHELIDFTVCIYVVSKGKVLFIYHKQLKRWLPLGGHIDLHEDPEEAAVREAYEESGLRVKLIGTKPQFKSPGTQFLVTPRFLDIHRITRKHRHVGMVYFARPVGGKLKLAEKEHDAIAWLSLKDLDSRKYRLLPAVKYYAKVALRELEYDIQIFPSLDGRG